MKKTGRHTFVVDGNYFLFRTLYVLPHNVKSKELLGSSDDVQSFMAKLATDFAYQVRLFDGLIDKIVWTVDSRSWRKDFYPESDYKGNRKQDSSINWKNFSKVSEDFINLLSKQGVIISKIDGAEGDDLMYAWNTESLANNKSVIMFTGDRDIVQLVCNNNNTHTILFSPAHKKLYTYQGFSEWMNTEVDESQTDIFDLMKVSISPEHQARKLLHTLVKKKKVDIIEVDPEEFRFKKVLTGDAGDNVTPAYWYVSKNRRYGISEKKAEEIILEFKQKHGGLSHMYLYNDELIKDLANITIRIMKAKHMSSEQIISNIKSNINLMVLSSESIPESILDEMFRSIETKINLNTLKLNAVSSMKSILENSSYKVEDNSISISSKIFSGDKDTSDFSFITDRKQKGKIF